ncbi:MAG: hypothetical protein AAGF46_06045 [Pseudomonadota bacterium]
MKQHDREILTNVRNDLRATLRASERRPRNLTDHERLEDIAFQLARTLKNLEHQLQSLDRR